LKNTHLLGVAAAVLIAAGALAVSIPAHAEAAPICSKSAAKRAVVATPFAARIKKRLGKNFFAGQPVMKLFSVYKTSCMDLTGDGEREMLVELGCCTGPSRDPWAIFVPQAGRWRLAFSRVATNHFGLRVGSSEATPPAARSDPPSRRSSPSTVKATATAAPATTATSTPSGTAAISCTARAGSSRARGRGPVPAIVAQPDGPAPSG
jgi:hypothetical protein